MAPEPIPKHRLYLPAWPAGRSPLPPDRAHYLTRVLRLRAGDRFVGFDGSGYQWIGQVARAARDAVLVDRGDALPAPPHPPFEILLGQAVARGERMDYALQKATELGVAAIQPLFAARTEVRLTGSRLEQRLRHWRGVTIGACEQSGRADLPRLAPPCALGQWLQKPPAGGFGTALVLAPGGARLRDQDPPGSRVCLLVGPEGGLTAPEVDGAIRAGFRAVGLGPRILRCETAGPVAIAALQALWGDLG